MAYFLLGLITYFLLSVLSAFLISYFYPQFRPAKVLIDSLLMSPFLGVIIYLKKGSRQTPEK